MAGLNRQSLRCGGTFSLKSEELGILKYTSLQSNYTIVCMLYMRRDLDLPAETNLAAPFGGSASAQRFGGLRISG